MAGVYQGKWLELANLRDYSSSAAIELILCGRQWGNESFSHALDLVHHVIGLLNFENTSRTRFKATQNSKVYNHMHQRLEGANTLSYGCLRTSEWILALILSLSLMGTALFEMVTHVIICIDGKTKRVHQSTSAQMEIIKSMQRAAMGKSSHTLVLVWQPNFRPLKYTPLKRDLRALKTAMHINICVAHLNGQIR